MGFFSLLETFFFISLAITFVLIIMLVYHFKGRLVLLEQKTNTMFEIMSSMIKEMKDIRESVAVASDTIAALQKTRELTESAEFSTPAFSPSMPFGGAAGGLFPPELFRMFQMGGPQQDANYDEDDDDDDDDDEEDAKNVEEYNKIVVSDTELDSDDEEEDDIRVISVDIETTLPELASLDDLEEQDILLDEEEDVDGTDGPVDVDAPTEVDETDRQLKENTDQVDFRKLDVSYLRTMVVTRGLATDTKKLKKSDLIRLLEG